VTPDRFLTKRQLVEEYGIPYSRCHLWRLARTGKFPAPVRLGANRIAYRESEIQAWLAARPRAHGREGGNAEASA
jgi:prophage regulatory protein